MKLRKFISWEYLLPLGIFILALFLRLYRLAENSPAIYADEASHYIYYQILRGQIPLNVMGVIDYIYRIIFSLTWLVGLNPMGARLSSAIFGSLVVLAVYLASSSITKNKITSYLFAILIAVMPWNFMISRIGHTLIPILVCLVLLHLYFYLRSQKTNDHLISLFFLGLCLFVYPSAIVIAPIIALPIIWGLFNKVARKYRPPLIAGIILIGVISVFLVNQRFQIFSPQGRGLDLAIWRDVNTPYEIDRYRALSWNSKPDLFSFGLPPEQLANKLVYNRVMANLSVFTRNYLSFFSPYWLFLHGDDILRHSTGQVGEFYPFLAPLMLYGAFKFFQIKDKKTKVIFLVWILASPIPAAITKDGAGYLLRVVTMLPFLTYFCALGIVESFGLMHKKLRWPYGIVLALIGLYSAFYFFYGYFHVYPSLSEQSYEFGFKELSSFQTAHQNASMLVIWDGYYHNMDFRFWQNTPYDQYLAFKMKRLDYGQSVFWQTFPNLYFSAVKSKEDLVAFIKAVKPAYIVLPDRFFYKYPEDINLLLSPKPAETILYPDQTPALTVYTVK